MNSPSAYNPDDDDESFIEELLECGFDDSQFVNNGVGQGVNWRDIDPSNVSYTTNEGRKEAFSKAVDEVNFLQKNLMVLCGSENDIGSIDAINSDNIIDLFFGKDGALTSVFSAMLPNRSFQSMNAFLAMFCLQSMMAKDTNPTYTLLKVMDVNPSKIPLTKERYEAAWRSIACKDRSFSRAATQPKPPWERLQGAVNDILRKISIEGSDLFLSLVIDDDKIWLNNTGSNAVNRFKLKQVRHTRDNRDGLNLHTVASSAMTVPINIQFETQGDSALKCYKRAIAYITNADDSNDVLEVRMESLTDRGYTSLERVKGTLLGGKDHLGTVARSYEWGVTYDQVLKAGDKRKHISTSGTSSLICQEASIGNKKLTLAAFKNGSQRVAMAISSKHAGHCWDGIPLNNNSTSPTESDYIS